jgi:hypothetical protein
MMQLSTVSFKFAENGVDYTSDPDNVIFTLADGKTKLTVPRTKILSVKFKDGCDIFSVTSVSNTIDIEFIGLTTDNLHHKTLNL